MKYDNRLRSEYQKDMVWNQGMGECKMDVAVTGERPDLPEIDTPRDSGVRPSTPQAGIKIAEELSEYETNILSGKMFWAVRKSKFYQNLCEQQIDYKKFDKKYTYRDRLLLIPGKRVSGKGLEDRLNICYIYFKRGLDRYTFGLDEDGENKEIFYKIPEGVLFDIIGKGKKIFALIPYDTENMLVYKLPDDVHVEIYFETDLYEGEQNLSYGQVSRESRYGFSVCNIAADSGLGLAFFLSFARSVDYKNYKNEDRPYS